MATTTKHDLVTVDVRRLSDGEKVGTTTMPAAEWERYAAGTHPGYQWPEGAALAGDVLTDEQVDEMGLDAGTVIWLED
jgi:hypothetical protein